MTLRKIVSGGQTGVDQAALRAAKEMGVETGGMMPKGWFTLDGPKPEFEQEFGMEEADVEGYSYRTHRNVRMSDGTLRLAMDFSSPGEICTLKAIRMYEKPYYDVLIPWINPRTPSESHIPEIIKWLKNWKIVTLNVAGNSETPKTKGIGATVEAFIIKLITATRKR